jgi:transcriptional regulator with XRE-family HTH domain
MQWTKIREARRQAAMTQAQLAETSGVSRATIARLEKGAEGPFPGTIQKIASALEVRPLEVVSRQVCKSVWCGPRRRRACGTV